MQLTSGRVTSNGSVTTTRQKAACTHACAHLAGAALGLPQAAVPGLSAAAAAAPCFQCCRHPFLKYHVGHKVVAHMKASTHQRHCPQGPVEGGCRCQQPQTAQDIDSAEKGAWCVTQHGAWVDRRDGEPPWDVAAMDQQQHQQAHGASSCIQEHTLAGQAASEWLLRLCQL